MSQYLPLPGPCFTHNPFSSPQLLPFFLHWPLSFNTIVLKSFPMILKGEQTTTTNPKIPLTYLPPAWRPLPISTFEEKKKISPNLSPSIWSPVMILLHSPLKTILVYGHQYLLMPQPMVYFPALAHWPVISDATNHNFLLKLSSLLSHRLALSPGTILIYDSSCSFLLTTLHHLPCK